MVATWSKLGRFSCNSTIVLKVISPLLLGFLSLSMYTYAKKGLGWSQSKSVFVSLLGSIYFVALRASWDQLREELGLVFFFVVLMLLINLEQKSWKRYAILSFAMIVVALSHQLVSVLMFGVVAFTIICQLIHKVFRVSANLIIVSLPVVTYFFIVYLSGVLQSGFLDYSTNVGSPLASWTGFTSYQTMLLSTGGLFLYCFIFILPLTLIGIRRFRNLQLESWLLISLILMLLPIASVSPYRWVLMLTYPLTFFATDALSRIRSIKWKRYWFTVQKIAIIYLVLSTIILSFGFIFATSEKPFTYFNPSQFNYYAFQIPSSMLQNTISLTDCQGTSNAIQWFKDNSNSSSLLLTHTVFYSWALLTLNESQVRNYGFEEADKAAMAAAQEGHSQLYLIWWGKGQGWYSQPTLPSSFQEVYQSGKIAIYNYTATSDH
jgi:hypothetical protein